MASTESPLRIVFFGPPNAGKTALIRQFLELSGASDEPELLVPAEDLAPGKPLREYLAGNPAEDSQSGIVLVDFDGRAAGELLAQPNRLQESIQDAGVAAVRTADAIVLTIDATVDRLQLLELFADFAQFLNGLQGSRAHGREVGGLPVFLTLTKSDRLFVPGESWEARVQARKKEIEREFEVFLKKETQFPISGYTFGCLEVHVEATAKHFPSSPEFQSFQNEPYGVQDLFDNSIQSAMLFRNRIHDAHLRLRWTLTGSSFVLGIMVASLLALTWLVPGADEDRLTRQLRSYQDREGPAAVRLSDRWFRKNRAELEAIRSDFAFDQLPAELQHFVTTRLQEYVEYQKYRERFRPSQPGPAEIRMRAEVDRLEQELSGDLAPPKEYAAAWADTEAVKLWAKWSKDLSLLRQTESVLHDWYRGLIRRGTLLLGAPSIDSRWKQDFATLQNESETLPFLPADPIPASPKLSSFRGQPLRYEAAYEFERVDQAHNDWIDTRNRLAQLRELADALGLSAGADASRAVLDLPEPDAELVGSLSLATQRLEQLKQLFQIEAQNDDVWATSRFPDPIRPELQRRLRRVHQTGLRHARRLILQRIGHGKPGFQETPALWQEVGQWLAKEKNWSDWGTLLRQLERWADPARPAEDPVAEMIAFLKRDSFAIDLQTLDLIIPDDLRDRRVSPSGSLIIQHSDQKHVFRLEPDARREGQSAIYRFRLEPSLLGRWTIRLGDPVTASVSLRYGQNSLICEWLRSRSEIYQYDRLHQEPTIRRESISAIVEPAAGVRLQAVPETGLPVLPALFPDLNPSPR